MRLFRLSQLFAHKYQIKLAQSPKDVIGGVKRDILTNYSNWVMGKYRALKILAEANEPYARHLYTLYNKLVTNIDELSPLQIFNRVNGILKVIAQMKAEPLKYRQSIHDLVEIRRESDKNYREQLKSGFETNLKNISFGLEKAAKTLRIFAHNKPLAGGAVEPQRKDLSKDKLLMFMRSPAAQQYGLDNMEVMTQLLSVPEIKNKLTTLINAVDRGHLPIDGPELMEQASELKKWLENREKTNLLALEQESQIKPSTLFEEEGEETE